MSDILTRRTRNSYRSQRRRATAAGQTLDYDFRWLYDMVWNAIAEPIGCPYCHGPLTVKNFSCDHEVPLARGGEHAALNLVVCCTRCNQIKGLMTDEEFYALLHLIETWPAPVSHDLLARLRAGGRRMR